MAGLEALPRLLTFNRAPIHRMERSPGSIGQDNIHYPSNFGGHVGIRNLHFVLEPKAFMVGVPHLSLSKVVQREKGKGG